MRQRRIGLLLYLLIGIIILFSGCSADNGETVTNEVTSFKLNGNPGVFSEKDKTITFSLSRTDYYHPVVTFEASNAPEVTINEKQVSSGEKYNFGELTENRVETLTFTFINTEVRTYSLKIEVNDEYKREISDIQLDGVNAGMDLNNKMILIPVNSLDENATKKKKKITFSKEDGCSVIINGQEVKSGESVALSKKTALIMRAPDGTEKVYSLYLTTLPIVILNADTIVDEPKSPCTFRLSSAEEGMSMELLSAGIEYRGSTSQKFPKKSFGIEFRDPDDWEEDYKVSLLGMREDEDWILNADYIDRSFLRNRVSMEIFRDLWQIPYDEDAKPYVEGTFVEVFLNGEYYGIYELMEKIDKKQLGLSKCSDSDDTKYGLLYKADNGRANFSADGKPPWHLGFEQEYPKTKDKDAWAPLDNILSIILPLYGDDSVTGEEYYGFIDTYFDVDNIVNWNLLILATQGVDNANKDYFLACETFVEPDTLEKFYFVPWDYDCTFGRDHDSSKHSHEFCDETIDSKMLFCLYGSDTYKIKLKQRWNELRADWLTSENLIARFEAWDSKLVESGAIERNFNRWPIEGSEYYADEDTHEEDMNYIRESIPKRLDYLDQYVNSL